MKKDPEAIINIKFIEMMKLLNIYLNHFPKHEKYALCNLIRTTAYELYNLIIEGQKKYYKKTTLTNLDIVHEKLRMQVNLAFELGYFNFKDGKKISNDFERYAKINILIDELGKMIGGWIKKIKEMQLWQ